MQIENSFEVPAPPDEVWAFMLDVERIAPCMPGAELTEIVDDRTWKGKVTVRLGPVALAYAGKVVMEERDDDTKRAVLKATGTETRGKGTASATVTSSLEPANGGGTKATMVADVTITGAAAQYGRGMIGDVSKKLTAEFASCLADRIGAGSAGGTEESTGSGAPAGAAGAAGTGGAGGAAGAAGAGGAAAGGGEGGGGGAAQAEGRAGAGAGHQRPPARPVSGFRLAIWALWRALGRLAGRLVRALRGLGGRR